MKIQQLHDLIIDKIGDDYFVSFFHKFSENRYSETRLGYFKTLRKAQNCFNKQAHFSGYFEKYGKPEIFQN